MLGKGFGGHAALLCSRTWVCRALCGCVSGQGLCRPWPSGLRGRRDCCFTSPAVIRPPGLLLICVHLYGSKPCSFVDGDEDTVVADFSRAALLAAALLLIIGLSIKIYAHPHCAILNIATAITILEVYD